MTKKLMLGAALSALMVSGAFAQSTPPKPANNPSQPPAVSTPAPKPADQNAAKPAEKGMTNTQASTGSASAQPEFVAQQEPDQFLASKFQGKEVVGSNNKKIGDIGDILFDKDGRILAYVISTGGFLGIGAKEVALPPSAFQTVPGEKGGKDKLKISMSQEQLKDATKFAEYKKPQPVTTGAGGHAAPGGLGAGGMRPGGAGAK